jgi:hypothetical protein
MPCIISRKSSETDSLTPQTDTSTRIWMGCSKYIEIYIAVGDFSSFIEVLKQESCNEFRRKTNNMAMLKSKPGVQESDVLGIYRATCILAFQN